MTDFERRVEYFRQLDASEALDNTLAMATNDDIMEAMALVWTATDDLAAGDDLQMCKRIVQALLTVPEVRAAVRGKV